MNHLATDEKPNETSSFNTLGRKLCHQAGYLPVPLSSVPHESLAELEVYLFNNRSYQLYRSTELSFDRKDYRRLIDSGVEFVYVSVRDHQAYYRTIEKSLEKIVADRKVQLERKSEILYSTSIELASQILAEPPRKKIIDRTENIARVTVELIIQDNDAFNRLFEVSNHDFYTATHMVNVCTSVVSLANKMGLTNRQFLQQLGTGAMLHDIGKIFIPSEVLNTQVELSEEQNTLIRSHVERGCEHLAKVTDLPPEVMAIVAQHHERMDGSGYPRGLKGDQISIMGRLAGIVDTFDAMTSVRPYREHTHSVEEALHYLEEHAPDKYDFQIVNAFNKLIRSALGLDNDNDCYPDKEYLGLSVSDESETSNLSGRKYDRCYFRLQALLRRIKRVNGNLTLDSAEKIIVHNISRSGLGLLSSQALKPDQNICVSISKSGSKKPGNLIAVVVRCVDHADGWFTVGAQFHSIQSPDAISDIKNSTFVRTPSQLTT